MIEIDENKNRVEIDENGNFNILNDNAIITKEDTSSQIKGYYIIDSASVIRLTTILNHTTIVRENDFCYRGHYYSLFTKDQDVYNIFEDLKKKVEGDIRNNKIFESKILELTNHISELERQIEKFNATRHWWERKLKIKE